MCRKNNFPLNIQWNGGFVAEVFDQTLSGLPDEETETDTQKDQEWNLPFSLPDPTTLKKFGKMFLAGIMAQAGNANWRGWLSTIDLLVKEVCFVKKANTIFNIKAPDLN